MRTNDAMQRHDFDPIAFTFGVLFTAAGLLFMIGRFDLFNHARWLWPGLLVLLGIAVLVGARGGSRTRQRAVGGTSATPGPVADVPDLNDIEPPVGPEAFRLPGWPPREASTPAEPVDASGTEVPRSAAASSRETTAPTAASSTEASMPEAQSTAETSEPPAGAGEEVSEPTTGTDTDVLEPAERETEVIEEVDTEAETRPLRERRPPEEQPPSS
jgi:hypothetical protein